MNIPVGFAIALLIIDARQFAGLVSESCAVWIVQEWLENYRSYRRQQIRASGSLCYVDGRPHGEKMSLYHWRSSGTISPTVTGNQKGRKLLA